MIASRKCSRCWCLLLLSCFYAHPITPLTAAVADGLLPSAALQRQLGLLSTQRLQKLMYRTSLQRQANAAGALGILRQQQPILDADPACSWSQEEGDESATQCFPLSSNWLILPGTPSSPYRRAALMALERDRFCGKTYNKESTCVADVANRCHWDKLIDEKNPVCSGADVYEMTVLSVRKFNVTVNTLPLAMTCPGTLANVFFTCYNHFGSLDSCDNLPACAALRLGGEKEVCMPKFLLKMSTKEVETFFDELFGFSPKVYGTCAAACWVSQARECIKSTNTSRSACENKAYCDFQPVDKTCTHRIIELDSDFDRKVYRLYAMCMEIDNQKDCEFNSKPKISDAVSGRYRNYTPDAEAVKCKL